MNMLISVYFLLDEAAASRYAEALLSQDQQKQDVILEVPSHPSEGDQRSKHADNSFSTREATPLFLQLRAQYNDKFNDRNTLKQALWQKIAEEMKKHGFHISDGREGA